ncbi:hypothetical protein BASA83_012577 [Batrachochytrium salamandrivorans]|nr:hypothetical protein BASA83_012577 [Batrachochytrium salamandrivorans]
MHHLLFLHATMPCGSMFVSKKSLMQSIKLRLYEADDDQAAVVMARLDEANQRSLQSFSNPELATKRELSSRVHTKRQGNPNKKSTIWSTRLGEMFAM